MTILDEPDITHLKSRAGSYGDSTYVYTPVSESW